MMRIVTLGLALALGACTAAPGDNAAASQSAGNASEAMAAMTEAQQAYADANRRMHTGMGNINADPDVAFMQGMIPHHRGAVDMAQIVLKHGKDPEARKLAQAVIATQNAEIAQMERWLAKRGKGPAATAAGGEHAGH